jgi:colanic acid/amylovoran biosynthesis glycosyltransferase
VWIPAIIFAPPVLRGGRPFLILAVGRLHPVKDHVFLVRACQRLKRRGISFACVIAGEGSERASIERQIRDFDVCGEVHLAGHLSRQELDAHYADANLVVLTSRSEGIPLVLMEAMARGKLVLAPGITGIPELVLNEENGFLYQPGSLEDFVARVDLIYQSESTFGPLGRAARQHVLQHFDREKNLTSFCNLLFKQISRGRISLPVEHDSYESPVLQ